jgi:hypothetical protein
LDGRVRIGSGANERRHLFDVAVLRGFVQRYIEPVDADHAKLVRQLRRLDRLLCCLHRRTLSRDFHCTERSQGERYHKSRRRCCHH